MKTILFSALLALNFMNTDTAQFGRPSFPGGNEALVQFIENELIYPETARENLIEGVAHICFVVMPNGTIKNCEIKGALDSSCKKAVEELIAKMPKWHPAMDGGLAVPRKVSFNIIFDLTDL